LRWLVSMRYLALVADYDGTLASRDVIPDATVQAIGRLKATGRLTIAITGRRLRDLLGLLADPRLFDLIVAENGAVVYDPETREEETLANPPSKSLLRSLRTRGVEPLEVGQVVVATTSRHRAAVQDVVWELGLEAQVVGNRGAVMVLPSGVNKATGLDYALRKLGLSRHEAVGIGDAENDHSFLASCECGVAVANAIPSIKEAAAFVTAAENGGGVIELIDEVIADDLHRLEGRLPQHLILLGKGADDAAVQMAPYGPRMLVAGPSGSGKSTFAASLVERLIEKHYQVCIVDPEGDYGTLRDVVALGNQLRTPGLDEILSVLEDPTINLSINLLGMPLGDRPGMFAQLLPRLQAMRTRTGRPHWLVVDEAHHMLPDTGDHSPSALPHQIRETILVTVHPDHVASSILESIDIVVATGESPNITLQTFAHATGRELQWSSALSYRDDHVIAWFNREGPRPFSLQPHPGRAERIRHRRKYAVGDLRWHSFYFRGPHARLNLKAQNLAVFCQIADGIDDEAWEYHLRRGDYSRWFRDAIGDAWLADETTRIEQRLDVQPDQSRYLIRELISARYTLPA